MGQTSKQDGREDESISLRLATDDLDLKRAIVDRGFRLIEAVLVVPSR